MCLQCLVPAPVTCRIALCTGEDRMVPSAAQLSQALIPKGGCQSEDGGHGEGTLFLRVVLGVFLDVTLRSSGRAGLEVTGSPGDPCPKTPRIQGASEGMCRAMPRGWVRRLS